jgi:ABC-type branched-subunit amino acid transport system substrate-binding protein
MGIISTIVIVVVALLAILFVLQPGKKELIKIGAVLSISGPGGFYGEEARDGLLLAVDEINAWGGINGRYIELIIEDSKTKPQEGKEGFKSIEEAHHPLLYVSNLSSVSVQDFRFISKRRLVDSKLEGG